MLLGIACFFAFFSRDFLGLHNLTNIGVQSTVLLMLALPMTLIIMTEGIDMSAGALLTLCGVVMAWMLARTHSLPLALLAAIAVGLLVGIVNGAISVYLKVPPFVVTLGTLGICQSLALVVTDGQSITDVGTTVQAAYSGTLWGVPLPLVFAALAYAVTHFLLYHTRFGTYVSAIGGNREALNLAGIRTNLYHVAVYAFGGVMAGLAALLLTARMSSGHPTAAIGMEFDAIAAVVVGGTSFERGNGWLLGTLLGVLTVGVLRNGLNLLGVASSVQVASIGLLVLMALLIDSWKVKA
jgi:ribose transport system permease protein